MSGNECSADCGVSFGEEVNLKIIQFENLKMFW